MTRQLPYKLQLNFSTLRFVFYMDLSCVQMEWACCVMCRTQECCTSSMYTAWILQGLISQQLERDTWTEQQFHLSMHMMFCAAL